jgi:hypothetical protein
MTFPDATRTYPAIRLAVRTNILRNSAIARGEMAAFSTGLCTVIAEPVTRAARLAGQPLTFARAL